MADFTKTITNSINVFGPAPSSKWGNYNWGAAPGANVLIWGEGSADLSNSVGKALSNSFTISDSLNKNPNRVIANSVIPSFETEYESLADSNGYNYVFVRPTINAELRNISTYATVSTSTSWSCAAVSLSSWSG